MDASEILKSLTQCTSSGSASSRSADAPAIPGEVVDALKLAGFVLKPVEQSTKKDADAATTSSVVPSGVHEHAKDQSTDDTTTASVVPGGSGVKKDMSFSSSDSSLSSSDEMEGELSLIIFFFFLRGIVDVHFVHVVHCFTCRYFNMYVEHAPPTSNI